MREGGEEGEREREGEGEEERQRKRERDQLFTSRSEKVFPILDGIMKSGLHVAEALSSVEEKHIKPHRLV